MSEPIFATYANLTFAFEPTAAPGLYYITLHGDRNGFGVRRFGRKPNEATAKKLAREFWTRRPDLKPAGF